MKKLFFLFAFSIIAATAINAASWSHSVSTTTGQSNKYESYYVGWLTGDFQMYAEANGLGAFAQSVIYFRDGSQAQIWAHGWNPSAQNKSKQVSGTAYKITLQAMTGEHGYYDPDALCATSVVTLH